MEPITYGARLVVRREDPRMSDLLKNADECRRMADNSLRNEDKKAWLRLAETWLRLAQRTGDPREHGLTFAWPRDERPTEH